MPWTFRTTRARCNAGVEEQGGDERQGDQAAGQGHAEVDAALGAGAPFRRHRVGQQGG